MTESANPTEIAAAITTVLASMFTVDAAFTADEIAEFTRDGVLRTYHEEFARRRANAVLVQQIHEKAKEYLDRGEAGAIIRTELLNFAAALEKAPDPYEREIEKFYGAYLEAMRTTLVSDRQGAIHGVSAQIAALLGTMDAKAGYPPRSIIEVQKYVHDRSYRR